MFNTVQKQIQAHNFMLEVQSLPNLRSSYYYNPLYQKFKKESG